MIARPRTLHLAAVAAFAVVVLALAPIAVAGKGGGGKPSGGGTSSGGGSISLAPMVVDANGDGLPSFGDTVTFNISTTATQPYVNLVCSQNGVQGYDTWRGYFAGSLDTSWNFTLGSGGWTSGAADCTAWLGMYTRQGFQRLASTSFHVGP